MSEGAAVPIDALEVPTADAESTREVARRLAPHLRAGDLLILDGPLGAGKTTFTQGLGEALGVRGPVASPTFVISRVHPSLRGGPALVHVDAYRLGSALDIEDLDLDADLDGAVTVAEWGRGRMEHLVPSHVLIELRRAQAQDAPDIPATAAATATAAAPDTPATPDGDDVLDEPRSLRITAVGERWSPAAVAALAADLADLCDPRNPAGHDRSGAGSGALTPAGPHRFSDPEGPSSRGEGGH